MAQKLFLILFLLYSLAQASASEGLLKAEQFSIVYLRSRVFVVLSCVHFDSTFQVVIAPNSAVKFKVFVSTASRLKSLLWRFLLVSLIYCFCFNVG